MRKIFIIEFCNYEDYPTGGHLSFAKQMARAFGDEIALIGISTKNVPVKTWIKKEIGGVNYDFFCIRKLKADFTKPLIPNRLKYYFYLRNCRKQLEFLKNENVFIQTPEVLFAIRNWGIKNICFRSPGVENMLLTSRFWYAKYLKGIYETILFKNLQKVNTILASADKNSIIEFCKRSNDRISFHHVAQFPTRIDTQIFKPGDRIVARAALRIDQERIIVVTTGRLSALKGWKFMIDSFKMFKKTFPDSILYFLGDGEERSHIIDYLKETKLVNDVHLTGKIEPHTISLYLNACNLYIMGSYIEGWSTSLVEAIACGVPVCTTNFSSAKELISENVNGFVCHDRVENEFADKMQQALNLSKEDLTFKSKEMEQYCAGNLKNEILKVWEVF